MPSRVSAMSQIAVRPGPLAAIGRMKLGVINSGSLAIFTAIRRASSLVSSLAADRRPGSSSK
jgi:hypothetical protein